MCNTKCRWGRQRNGSPEEQEEEREREMEEPEMEEQMRMDREITEESTREIYNPENNTIDF